MRRFIVIAAAVAIAVLGFVFIEGKPEANACRGSGGPIVSEDTTTTLPAPSGGSSAPSVALYGGTGGMKHGKDSAVGD